jgi:cell division protein FtsN
MKPDFEEFDDYANENESSRSRAMSWLVLGVALSGFVALAWYAYNSGSESIKDGQMVVIKADEAPIKEKPEVAGGEAFPHQDKTIYDTISPYRAKEEAKVEKLLPEAEEPVAAAIEEKETETKTWVNDKLRPTSDAEEAIRAQLEKAEVKKEEIKEVAKVVAKEEAISPPVVKTPKPEEISKPAAVKVEVAKPAPVAAPAPVKAAPASSGSGFKIQLGAYSSEAEAKQNWARISSKYASQLGGHSHIIAQAVVNGRTVYRLRVAGYATADVAKQACAKLSTAGQACFFAGK